MPALLVATVALNFLATLGVSALVFRQVFGFGGTDPSVPLFGFVFLVALGVDYNIFLMSRVREESPRHGVRQGVLRGLVTTGGVITSAGVVLAATFAAFGVIPPAFSPRSPSSSPSASCSTHASCARCWCRRCTGHRRSGLAARSAQPPARQGG